MKYLLKTSLLAFLTLLAACGHEDEPTTPEVPDTTPGRTVIVYVAANNNLTSMVVNNINDMLTGTENIGKNDRLIAFIARQNEKKSYVVRIDKKQENPIDTVLTYPQKVNTANAEVMSDALKWIVRQYPNDSYGLVLWGHSTGWKIENTRGYGYDNGQGPEHWMDMPQLSQTLTTLPHFKFIFADCCNFQCLESAYELKNVADYVIGSPAEIPNEGAPYDQIMPYMFNKNDEAMYQNICDLYAQKAFFLQTGGQTEQRHTPMSVIRTARMQELADATREVVVNDLKDKTFNMQGLVFYSNGIGYESSPEDNYMYDARHFMLANLPASSFAKWETAFNQAVVRRHQEGKWITDFVDFKLFDISNENFGGASMFVPLARYDEETSYRYNQYVKQLKWYQAAGWSEIGW